MTSFFARLDSRARAVNSLLCVGLDPHSELLPESTASAALTFCKRLVDETHDLACVFKPNSAFFEAFGADGYAALRDLIAYIHSKDSHLPVILDAKRGDIASTAEAYARAAFEYLDADAITVNPYMGTEAVSPFTMHTGKGAFVLCRTTGGGESFQTLEGGGMTIYEVVAATFRDPEKHGLVVGATDAIAISRIRELAPQCWFLIPGVGTQGGDLTSTVLGGLRADGLGVLINASRSIAKAADPRAEAASLREAINIIRSSGKSHAASDIDAKLRRRIATALHAAGCVRFGKFRLKSGIESPIYLDLRRLISVPSALRTIAEALQTLLVTARFDHLAAIPYAALPIGTAAALIGNYSLIYPRREPKDYGTQVPIEGAFKAGETALVLDDLATTGESKFEAIQKLHAAELVIRDIVVVIDREQGAKATLEAAGYHFHALITLSVLLDELQQLGTISAAQRTEVDAFLATQP